MPIRYVTYANGFTEIFGEDRTPAEECEWLNKVSGVSRFPSANHRAAVKASDKKPPKHPQKNRFNRSSSHLYLAQ